MGTPLMRYRPRGTLYDFERDEHEPGPLPIDFSAGLRFTPVPGRPGFWKAPHPAVRRAAVAGFYDDRASYDIIAAANPELFRHGQPTAVHFFDRTRNRIDPLIVKRAPYIPEPLSLSMDFNDPRLNPTYHYELFDLPDVMQKVAFYDELYRERAADHLAKSTYMNANEAYVDSLHEDP